MTLQIINGYILFILFLITILFLYFKSVPMHRDKKVRIIKNSVMWVFSSIVILLAYFAIFHWV